MRRAALFLPATALTMCGAGGLHVALAFDETRAEKLFQENRHQATVELLREEVAQGDAAALWRSARATRFLGQQEEALIEKKLLTGECLRLAEEAVAHDPTSWEAHKWLGICLNQAGEYEGTKTQLLNSFRIKEHWEKAFELNGGKDATTAYLMGEWAFYFANMGWVTRNLARALFASPPTASYQQALDWFLKAEELDPGFSLVNRWCIAKTYKCLGNKEQFQAWKLKAKQLPINDVDDEKAMKELLATE